MLRVTTWVSFVAVMFFLAGCATIAPPNTGASLDDIIIGPSIAQFPYQKSRDGQLVIPVSVNGSEPALFAIDTGATKSAIFRLASSSLNIPIGENPDIRVHGLVESEDRPVVTIENLNIGPNQFYNVDVAVLENRQVGNQLGGGIKGLIGLDLLARLRMYLDADNEKLYFIPATEPTVDKPEQWKHVELISNPYQDDGRDLKFLIVDFNGKESPALLDSGSAVNFMNWEIAQHPKIKRMRKRLKKKWTVEGATGTFDPKIVVTIHDLQSGNKNWESSKFIVMNVNSLDVLGISGKPFAIAGVDMIASDSFYLDFANNTLFLRDSNSQAGKVQVTGSRLRRRADTLVPGVLSYGQENR